MSCNPFQIKPTSSQKQNRVKVSVQRWLLVHSYSHVVNVPFEHEWAQPDWVHLTGHQWVPSDKSEDVIREVSRGVDALRSVHICNTLQRNTKDHRWLGKSDIEMLHEEWVCWKPTDPGLGSGTLPVYSLHFESCTSMYGPSKTFCTSEKAYWQIADALIFFLEHNQTPHRSTSGLMIHREVIIRHPDWISNTSQIINFQSQDKNAPLWLRVWVLQCLGSLRSYQCFLNECVGGPLLTGMRVSLQ